MNLLDLVRDPLFRSVLMVIWLLPCALQDYRTRRVSNWLTVPQFCLAWPVALLTDHLALTFAVFIGVYVATKLEPRAGAADGKVMVGLAAFAPLALGMGVLLEVAVFITRRLRGQRDTPIPGALWLYLGSVLSVAAWVVLAVLGIGHFCCHLTPALRAGGASHPLFGIAVWFGVSIPV